MLHIFTSKFGNRVKSLVEIHNKVLDKIDVPEQITFEDLNKVMDFLYDLKFSDEDSESIADEIFKVEETINILYEALETGAMLCYSKLQ
jgi:hypothetical protein